MKFGVDAIDDPFEALGAAFLAALEELKLSKFSISPVNEVRDPSLRESEGVIAIAEKTKR